DLDEDALDDEVLDDELEDDEDEVLDEAPAPIREEEEDDDDADDEADAHGDDRSHSPLKVLPKQPGEFVCQSCFLVKHPSQLADREAMLCRDCVDRKSTRLNSSH